MPRYPKGVTKLSQLEIDADKDWSAKKIENLGAPDSGDDAPRDDTIDSKITTHKGDASAHHAKTTDAGDITSGRFGKSRLEWTAEKLLRGAGAGADPTEIDVPGRSLTSDPSPLVEGDIWYRSDLEEFRGAVPSPFGGEVKSAASPSTIPSSIGGDSSTIWHCDDANDVVYELNTSDFSVSRSASSPSTGPSGIGGDSSTIWHCDNANDVVYELNTSDFSVSRSASSPSISPTGIGGDSSTIWHCDSVSDVVYELNTSDFSVSRSASSPSTGPTGIGGDSSTIWHCDNDADVVYELYTGVVIAKTFSLT